MVKMPPVQSETSFKSVILKSFNLKPEPNPFPSQEKETTKSLQKILQSPEMRQIQNLLKKSVTSSTLPGQRFIRSQYQTENAKQKSPSFEIPAE